MRIITWGRVQAFIDRHADSERPLRAWRTQIQSREYPDPGALLAVFPYVSIIDDQRVVFNIKGNEYRLVAAIHFDKQRLFVRGVFTHRDYDRIDVRTIRAAEGSMRDLDFSTPHLLRDEVEYEAAQAELDRLLRLDPRPFTKEYEALEFYSVLIEEYESERFPYRPAPARDVVDFMLEQKGMTRAELAEVMGGRSRVSDYFNGKRELSKGQAIALSRLLDISLDVLLLDAR